MILKVHKAELPLIDEGTYVAEFTDYDELKNLQYGDAISLKFKITDSEGKHYGTTLNMLCSEKFTTGQRNSKLYDTVKAIIDEEPNEELDLDSLKGTICKIVVKTKGSNDKKFSAVVEVLSGKDV